MKILFKTLTILSILNCFAVSAKDLSARKTASTLEEFSFPTKIEEYHCTLILAAEQLRGTLEVLDEYERFTEHGLIQDDVVNSLKQKSVNARKRSVYRKWEEKIYCSTKVYSPINQ